MKKIAIIGATYLQEPLIRKAKEMGLETHVFAWAANDVGEKIADFFYPISIIEKEEILGKCIELEIDAICSIASDLAVITVNYVAEKMNLTGNSIESALLATNKHEMRLAFEKNNDPSPHSVLVRTVEDINSEMKFPVIVKPLDRSGSRGVSKINSIEELPSAIKCAEECGFIKGALIEQYVEGREYSVECISYQGTHHFLAITQKYTTGAPNFIETGHLEPAQIDDEIRDKVKNVIFHALNSLKIKNGASHSEIKIDDDGNISIIEIGSRMGGDLIGSELVYHTTGIDYVKAVIQIALGEMPDLSPATTETGIAAIHYVCSDEDIYIYKQLLIDNPDIILVANVPEKIEGAVTDSASRFGYYVLKSDNIEDISPYMPRLC